MKINQSILIKVHKLHIIIFVKVYISAIKKIAQYFFNLELHEKLF